MIWLFILCCVCAIVLLIYSMANSEMDSFCSGMMFAIGVLIAFILGGIMWGKPLPRAIDVYRGRTTLEITYRDSVALDSVVVFKDELKEQQQ